MYRCIDQLQQKAEAVASLCRLLGVSRSGYYAARQRARQPVRVCPIAPRLQAAFSASGRSYGSRRLCVELNERGIAVGRYRMRTLMRVNGIKPVWKRKFIHTTDSEHNLPIAANVLDRHFEPTAANVSWVADMTYIRTRSGWLYLAAVMDLFSRKIIGWAMAPSMPAELVCSALSMAITQRNPAPGLIVHSDRGSQYASDSHRALLTRHGLCASMSRKGNCWDNAVMERFFLNLKMERVWQRDYANRAEATCDIADYIVGFYNSVRLHSTLGYLPPNAFELKSAAKQPIDVSEIT
jgi:putative transposase